jgi:hypothetical protein
MNFDVLLMSSGHTVTITRLIMVRDFVHLCILNVEKNNISKTKSVTVQGQGTHTLLGALERANLIHFQGEATKWVCNSPNLSSQRDTVFETVETVV